MSARPATAIVLARAGSKGLPGKNTMPLRGKACIAWTIEHALASERVGRVVVSTDGAEIAAVARSCGAEVVDRPDELAGDGATIDDAARHAVAELGEGSLGGRVALLYANVPVRPPDLTDRALALLDETGADSVQSYAPVGKFHPWWTAVVDPATGAVRPWQGDTLNGGVYRRQDLPPAHIPDGGVIALTVDALALRVPGVEPGPHAFFGLDRRAVLTPEGAVVDIDGAPDAARAEAALGAVA